MCFSKLFKTLPYPEEPKNFKQTVENTDVNCILLKWLENYRVPAEYWEYWQIDGVEIKLRLDTIIIMVDGNPEHAPAQTTKLPNGKTLLEARPEYFNPGVVAHEQAHNSYMLLAEKDKADWPAIYQAVKKDKLVKLVFEEHRYAYANDIEAHAEIYRYLGPQMPEVMKGYYPKLF